MKDLFEQSSTIHEIILNVASSETLVVGFPSKTIYRVAYRKLCDMRFRKPFFASRREWTRRAIVFEPNVYRYMAPHVELEFISEDSLVYYNGTGVRIRNTIHESEFAQMRPPTYWVICLGGNLNKFEGILD